MGNDGGSIPTRRELVKEAARNPSTTEIKESQQEQQEYLWTTDPISQQPLAPPIVSDSNGKLYNKETILEYLVESARKEDADRMTQGTVKSLKDLVEVKFEGGDDKVWKCPVTGDKLGPGSKAVYLVPCGHAFSGSAIKEVSGEKCLTCDTEYASNDIIPILSTVDTDIARLVLRRKTLLEKGLSHSLKKAAGGKKRKKRDVDASVEDGDDSKSNGNGRPQKSEKEDQDQETSGPQGIHNANTASLTAKVLQEQEKSKKRRTENDNVRSLFSSKDQTKPHGKSADFMTRGYSLPSGGKG